MITFDNITKSFGTRVLFDNVTFNVGKGEKIGLVGKNGHGKTTMFKIIAGTEIADSGKVAIPKNYKIGYLQQNISFTKDTVIDEAMTALSEEEQLDRWKAEKILFGLGFNKETVSMNPAEFSGGYQIRLTLAKTLLMQPDMLLLDEPTNYLDIVSIRWLKSFLNTWKGELILITHDRQFMDDIITHTVGIHRGKVRKIEGKTEKYYECIAKDEEIYEKTRVNDEQKRRELELYITRFRAKARLAGLVQSRVKTLSKMEKRDRLEQVKNLEFSFRYKPFNAKQIMHCDNITFGYKADEKLIDDLSIIIGSEDRIAIIGKNGKGKSTLMRIMAGILSPNGGKATSHTGSAVGYFEQTNISSLNPKHTVEEEIQSVSDNLDKSVVRSICGAMLFEQDHALKKIEVLSGGEKSRVMLGKVIAMPLNLIMLDEPTNHLDMDSCDALIEALDNFDGALVMVTHNELILHGLATKLIVFQGDKPFVFDGTYQEFLDNVGWEDEAPATPKQSDKPKVNKKDLRRLRSEIISEKNATIKPLQARVDELEILIDKLENEMNEKNAEAIELATSGEGKKIAEVASAISKLEKDIETFFDELVQVSETLTLKTEEFDNKLSALEEE